MAGKIIDSLLKLLMPPVMDPITSQIIPKVSMFFLAFADEISRLLYWPLTAPLANAHRLITQFLTKLVMTLMGLYHCLPSTE